MLTGKQLKEKAAAEGLKFVKYLPFNDFEKNKGKNKYQYQYGANVPQEPVNIDPEDTCCEGGLYFTDTSTNCWVGEHTFWVFVPDDAQVYHYVTENKYKASILIIEREWTKEEYAENIKLNLRWFRPLRQTPELCLMVVRKNGLYLKYVNHQTPEICLAAVKENPNALLCVNEKTPEICLIAVTRNGNLIEYVKKQTREICLAAVRQNGNALQYVREQTPEICLAAVQQNGLALRHVKKLTQEISRVAILQKINSRFDIKIPLKSLNA